MRFLLITANMYISTLIAPGHAIIPAYLKHAGHKVKVFDTTFYPTDKTLEGDIRLKTGQVKSIYTGVNPKTTNMRDDLRKLLSDFNPDLVGLSCVEPTYKLGMSLLSIVKGLDIPTIVGGICAISDPEGVLTEDCADMICIGEGEKALVELCNDWKIGYSYDDINPMFEIGGTENIWYKNIGGEIITNELHSPIDLDTLPFQDYSFFKPERLLRPMNGKLYRAGCVEVSRGCPYSCSFCCNEKINKLYKKYFRKRAIISILNELKFQKNEYGINFFFLLSESICNLPEYYLKILMRNYKEEIDLPFWCEARPETVTDEKIKILAAGGCESISMGIECGNEDYRRGALNRKMSNEQIINAFDIVNKYSIRSCANNIIGFPLETKDMIQETIDLNRLCNPETVIVSILEPYKGTSIRKTCEDLGLIDKDTLCGDPAVDIYINNPNIANEELRDIYNTFVDCSKN